MKAVILAGGFGTRLRPLSANIPKPMVPVMNTPMLEHIINLLKGHGFKDITMMLYFQPEAIMNYFSDGKDFGVNVDYIISNTDLGTAGCITPAKEKLKDETFLIISGDVFTNFDLSRAIETHKEKGALATIVLTRVKDPLRYGIIVAEKDGRIAKLLEKPSWGEVFSDTINTGIYVFEPEIFEHIPDDTDYDFSKNLFPSLLEKKLNLYGAEVEGYWRDIGTLGEYRSTHEDIFNGDIDCDIKGERKGKIGKDVWVGKNCTISPGAKLKGSVVIGDSCRIESDAELSDCVIGKNCFIDKNAKLTRTILWENNIIEQDVNIKEAVVGSGNKIRYKAYIGVNAVISDNCEIGKFSTIKPEVKMWPDKKVDEGSVVSSSMVTGERWSSRLFDAYGITSTANMELTPEIASRIGAAYASAMPKGSYVLISRDYHRSSYMIERAIISGILSCGVNIYDFRVIPVSVPKYVAKSLDVAGGLHIRKSPYDRRMIDIKIFDKDGLDLSVAQEKSIESYFFREEYRRASGEKMGAVKYPPRAFEYYRDGLLNSVDRDAIAERKFKIIIDYSYSSAVSVLPSVFGELNCEVIALNAYYSEEKLTKSAEEFKNSYDRLSNTVKTLRADAGIMIDAGAQKIYIADNKGRVLFDEAGLMLMSKLFLKNNPGAVIGVPVTVTNKIDSVAAEQGGRLIRVGTSYRSMMAAAHEKKTDFVAEEKGGFIFSDFLPAFDSMIATLKLLEYLAKEDAKLSELVDSLPKYNKEHYELNAPWDERGRVMKELLEFKGSGGGQDVEGIQYVEENARVLIIPDNDRPFFHIYADGNHKRSAAAAVNKYRKILYKIVWGREE